MATFLEISKKNSDPSSTLKTLSYGVKIAKIARGFFCLRHKIGCHGNVPSEIGKTGLDQEKIPFI